MLLQRIRESLTLWLITLLPLHALLVTVLTRVIAGHGHAPLASIALWKEGLLGVILCLCIIEFLALWRRGSRTPATVDVIDVLILALLALSFVLPIANSQLPQATPWFLGFKYDFIPLVSFLILRRVPWSDFFKKRVMLVILWVGAAVAAYGIATLFLPDSFFLWLGYSPLHSLYIPEGPLAAFQQIGGSVIRRIQSTMSGPNQLGLWLLLPLALSIGQRTTDSGQRKLHLFYICMTSVALVLTFSRAAWIAAVVIVMVIAFVRLPRRAFWKFSVGISVVLLSALVLAFLSAPQVLTRIASSRDHVARPIAAVNAMIAHPLGQGLGSAGPATNRTSDACVYVEEGADTTWAKDQPNLCVFVGGTQTQPATPCDCPFLPENWYLQIGVELGILGMFLYIGLIACVLRRLWKDGRKKMEDGRGAGVNFHLLSFVLLLGVSIAALFLHAWEDAAVAYTVWMLVAVTLPGEKQKPSYFT